MKTRYALALKSYVYAEYKEKVSVDHIDVYYSFVEGSKIYKKRRWDNERRRYEQVDAPGFNLILHRLAYMCLPHPGYADFNAMKGDADLLRLFVVEMKGFQYVTNCGSWKLRDGDVKQEVEEWQNLAGEKLRPAKDKAGNMRTITRSEFNMRYRSWDYERLSEGLYRILDEGGKKARGKEKGKSG
jgi:hypothetical protein